MMTALIVVVAPIAVFSALLWIAVGLWWQYLEDLADEAAAARREPIPGRDAVAEFRADIDTWRMRQKQGARK